VSHPRRDRSGRLASPSTSHPPKKAKTMEERLEALEEEVERAKEEIGRAKEERRLLKGIIEG